MAVRVAITRAQPEAERTAARVRALGAEAIIAPLLTIEPQRCAASLAGVQAIVFTSISGVRAFSGLVQERGIPALTVGDATAEAARGAGFTEVRSADGDSSSLAALAAARLDPARGKLVYVSGDHVARDLDAELTARGFEVERRIAYASVAVSAIPVVLEEPLEIVLFHSPRAAKVYVDLGAPRALERIAACLSENVAAAARLARWREIIVAPAPREDALLAACLGGQNSPAGASA